MQESTADGSVMTGVRVLDLTDQKGVYAAKILADMGADVVKVEPPQGDAMRHNPPFVDDVPGTERSLYWLHYNTNKRGVTLDIETSDGQDLFRRLSEKADIILECFPPGYLAGLGLGYADLSKGHPELIMTSITNFGQEGPKKDWVAGDLHGTAMGGYLYPNGYPDRPPVKIYGEQAYMVTSHYGVISTMMAYIHRLRTGEGQYIDVSMQAAVAAATQTVIASWIFGNKVVQRPGPKHSMSGQTTTFEAKDGWVGVSVGAMWNPMLEWMEREGMVADLRDPMYSDREVRSAMDDHIAEVISAWAKNHDRQELMDWAQGRHLPVGSGFKGEEIMSNPQLQARGFFIPLEHPEFDRTFTYPGPIFEFSKTPWKLRHRAPQLGEHNAEIYRDELGLSNHDLGVLASYKVI